MSELGLARGVGPPGRGGRRRGRGGPAGRPVLRQDVNKGPTKIGLAHRMGWVAYLNSGTLFVKRFDFREGAVYPDWGTRYQTFTYQEMLEMETVGELVTLQPGQSAELNESWELHGNVPPVRTEDDVDRVIVPLLRSGM